VNSRPWGGLNSCGARAEGRKTGLNTYFAPLRHSSRGWRGGRARATRLARDLCRGIPHAFSPHLVSRLPAHAHARRFLRQHTRDIYASVRGIRPGATLPYCRLATYDRQIFLSGILADGETVPRSAGSLHPRLPHFLSTRISYFKFITSYKWTGNAYLARHLRHQHPLSCRRHPRAAVNRRLGRERSSTLPIFSSLAAYSISTAAMRGTSLCEGLTTGPLPRALHGRRWLFSRAGSSSSYARRRMVSTSSPYSHSTALGTCYLFARASF